MQNKKSPAIPVTLRNFLLPDQYCQHFSFLQIDLSVKENDLDEVLLVNDLFLVIVNRKEQKKAE